MNNYGLRGFFIAFTVFFIVTFKGCNNAWSGTAGTDYFSLTMISIIAGGIIGTVGLLIGKQFKTEKPVYEKEFLLRNKKIILFILPSILVILYFFGRYNSALNPNKVSDNLKNNLGNLNGEWAFKNDKEDETWWLQICCTEDAKNGTYILSRKPDSWGENTDDQQTKTVSTGEFKLVEGYDIYGDKAYIGKNKTTGNAVFAITQIENELAADWMLRISIIEDVMFGKQMNKLSNQCK
jgi:hypothetical protein